ncbi:hypothetical protein AVEN_163171-1 [Araneus ventricosus]|uniref:Uncharacterized protein n=1 Tax=Araneus ventricosus TaxID=182803 RepID=A0A4Y2M386_ARAVE|nr:hypothetical protein AVEN_163171-1 [Araneus ventricosus]
MPGRTLTFKGDSYCGERNSNDHLTLLLGANTDSSEEVTLTEGFSDPKLKECYINNENDVDKRDDKTVIMNEDWNLLRAEGTFEEYVNSDADILTL